MTPSLRRHVLEEWRGLPEPRAGDRMVEVKDGIERFINKLGLSERICEAEILAAWRDIVGGFIAEHASPSRLVNGTLHVRVLQPTVRYELDRTWKPKILLKLQERFGRKAIREIQFRT
jgi:predicted nucleic acid-binding Zn ribbon protein